MTNNSKKQELKEKLLSLAERSTFHAIPNMVQTDRRSMRIIWIICLLVSSAYCASVLITNTIEFLKFEVETVIKIDRESDAEFPTVTVCYVQICSTDPTMSQQQYNIDKDLAIFKSDPNFYSLFNKTKSILETTKELFKTKTQYNSTLKTLLKKYNDTKSIKDYLISCQYSSEYCYENDFEYFQLGEFQRCFKFNSGRTMLNESRPIRKARRYGKNYGLQLELVVGLPEKCNLPLVSSTGLILYVHNSSYTISEDSSSIQLAPGTETNIAIDRTFVNKLPDPYSDCIDIRQPPTSSFPTKSVEMTFQYTSVYTQQTCNQLCYQQYLIKYHQCYDESLPKTEKQKASVNGSCPKLIDVLENPSKKLIDNSNYYTEKIDSQCLKDCPTECEYVTYDTTISSSQFPTVTYNEILVKNENVSATLDTRNKDKVDYDRIKSSILSVNVFYRSDMFKRIKEKPAIETEIFVSNLGGAIGLFLGISVLSIVEIFEMIYEVIVCYFNAKTNSSVGVSSGGGGTGQIDDNTIDKTLQQKIDANNRAKSIAAGSNILHSPNS